MRFRSFLFPLILTGCFGSATTETLPPGPTGEDDSLQLVGDHDLTGSAASLDADASDLDAAFADEEPDGSSSEDRDAALDATLADATTNPDVDDATTVDTGPVLGGECAPCSTDDDCLDTHLCHPTELFCYWRVSSGGGCVAFPGNLSISNFDLFQSSWHCKPDIGCAAWCSTTGLCE